MIKFQISNNRLLVIAKTNVDLTRPNVLRKIIREKYSARFGRFIRIRLDVRIAIVGPCGVDLLVSE